jgi:hypothetical protein
MKNEVVLDENVIRFFLQVRRAESVAHGLASENRASAVSSAKVPWVPT